MGAKPRGVYLALRQQRAVTQAPRAGVAFEQLDVHALRVGSDVTQQRVNQAGGPGRRVNHVARFR